MRVVNAYDAFYGAGGDERLATSVIFYQSVSYLVGCLEIWTPQLGCSSLSNPRSTSRAADTPCRHPSRHPTPRSNPLNITHITCCTNTSDHQPIVYLNFQIPY